MTDRRWTVALLIGTLGFLPARMAAQTLPHGGPIIDVHLHAFDMTWATSIAAVDSTWWPDIPRPSESEELLTRTIETLRQQGVVKAVASGNLSTVANYRARAPEMIIPAVMINSRTSPDALRRWYKQGAISVLGEAIWQYQGLSPSDPRIEPLWAVAAELDLPVGIHLGIAPPRWPELTPYRSHLGDPLDLEEVIARHPDLRIYVMHAGWPFLDKMIALLYSSPSVYVDVSVINWYVPREEFHHYLKRLVEAGFVDRIMYGSDQMIWPAAIPGSIEAISGAPFLSDSQKRAILCENAARFFRLEDGLCG